MRAAGVRQRPPQYERHRALVPVARLHLVRGLARRSPFWRGLHNKKTLLHRSDAKGRCGPFRHGNALLAYTSGTHSATMTGPRPAPQTAKGPGFPGLCCDPLRGSGLAAATVQAGLTRAVARVVVGPRVLRACRKTTRISIRRWRDGNGQAQGGKSGKKQVLHRTSLSSAGRNVRLSWSSDGPLRADDNAASQHWSYAPDR